MMHRIAKCRMASAPPVVLSIAGSDSSAGAGVQADLKTISALGGYGVCAVTSVVSEAPGKVSRIQHLDPALISDQIQVLDGAFPIAAAKTGMIGNRDQLEHIIRAWSPLAGRGVPLVVDPVMIATSGTRLMDEEAMALMASGLFPVARVITPNLDEAAALLRSKISSRAEMEQGAHELERRHGCAVLVKGGHLSGDAVSDVLVVKGESRWYESRRIPGVRTHGTGCTLSAAIATGLAQGRSLDDAVARAKQFVSAAIADFHRWGQTDALNHFAQPRV